MGRGCCHFLVLCSCLTLAANLVLSEPAPERSGRPFRFSSDALAFANELAWEYELEPQAGRMVEQAREPKSSYTLHCFALTRTARQFFDHARFDPTEPRATHASYRYLVHSVLARGRGAPAPDGRKLIIPGYANLRAFSRDYEALLKEEIGGAWQSFFQRGNWRMIFPFSRRHQERTAGKLMRSLERGEPPVAHLVCFPELTLNHFVLVFDSKKTSGGIEFTAYDPNQPRKAVTLTYQSGPRQFAFSRTPYFPGGRVKVYQVYCGALY